MAKHSLPGRTQRLEYADSERLMKHRYDYKVCPFCGAALDVGEACDCMDEAPLKTAVKQPKTKKAYKRVPKARRKL